MRSGGEVMLASEVNGIGEFDSYRSMVSHDNV